MILRSPSVLRPARVRPFLLAALAATSLSGCEFTQSLFRGRSTIPEAPTHPYGGGPGPMVVKPPSIVAGPSCMPADQRSKSASANRGCQR